MTIAVIDGDIVAYRCAASANQDPPEIALIRARKLLTDTISVTGASEIRLFLSGSRNFRYDLYPDYKANRKDMVRPVHLQAVREHLVVDWGAEVTDGYEADDAIGVTMEQGSSLAPICCSIDKDLKQLAGTHYNFVTGTFEHVTEIDGWRNFYKQCILGDRGDNIPGFDGKMRVKFPKFLEPVRQALDAADSPRQMYDIVLNEYKGDEQTLTRNARLLYLWRKENDEWTVPPTNQAVSSEAVVEAEVQSASTPTKQGESSPSTGRGGMKQKTDGFPVRGRKRAISKGKKRRVR